MISLLKEVGRGKRGARDLTYEEAAKAAEKILRREATDAQIGAFLLALRIKMESPDEIAAFVDALRKESVRHPMAEGIDCAGPYNGRTKSFFATLPSAFVVASCGIPVTLHGSRPIPPKWGVTLPDVISRWGVDVDSQDGLARLFRAADETGFLFVPAGPGCPALERMRDIRTQLGLRTLFNTAEKLLRYSEAPYLALGVFHGTVIDKTAQLLPRLGYRKALIVQGSEGSEDLPVTKRSRLFVVQDGTAESIVIDPQTYRLQHEPGDEEWNAERQAEMTAAVLTGDAPKAYTDMTLLNSGVRLWLAGAAGSIEEGLDVARGALSSGKAHRKFLQWLESANAAN